jgi:SHS2 domain-containing protein
MTYKFLEHTADIKFVAEGNSLEEAFIESSKALKEAICRDIKILEQETKEIEIKGNNLENLLYNFLEEFIVLLDSEDFLISEIKEIKIDAKNFTLKAEISGDKIDNYKFTNDVKAITYNEMFVKNENGIWKVQVVLDV